jgi:quercetin dioxygenase-like cupin family protein
MRFLTCTILCLVLLGCGRASPAPDAADPARGMGDHLHQAHDSPVYSEPATMPLMHSEPMDTLRDPVAGVVARFSGDPRAARMIPLRPMTADSEILYGDPSVAGQPFVIRIRELPGLIVPPHSHPVDEHLTVVQGTWYFGIGEEFDPTKLRPLPAGSYAFVPAGTTMFAYSPDPAVVQVHGVGPFDIHWKHGMITPEDPEGETAFRFGMGETVRTARGEGRIRWGGASGRLIQYEIEGADGSLFTVQEHELQRP